MDLILTENLTTAGTSVVPWNSYPWTDGVRSACRHPDMGKHADPIVHQGTDVYLRLPKLVSRTVHATCVLC